MVETQLGQLVNAQARVHKQRQFQSNIEPNSKTSHCHAIELQNGTRYTNEAMEIEDLGDGNKSKSDMEEINDEISVPAKASWLRGGLKYYGR